MIYPSDAEFWRLHTANRKTDRYRMLRKELIEKAGGRCCVCGLDYLKNGYGKWQLQADHKRYRDSRGLIFGREKASDFRIVCPDHHGKGIRSDASMSSWAADYRWLRVISWVCFLPTRAAWAFLRYLWRCLWHAPRRVD